MEPRRAAGTDGRRRRITTQLCAGAMGMTQRFIAAGPLSDQDIMPRYRMTPPARGRPPVDGERGALQPASERAKAKARRATLSFAARAFAAADVESLPSADCQVPIEKNFIAAVANRQSAIGNRQCS